MSDIDLNSAERGVGVVIEAVGLKGVSPGELALIAEAVVGLVQVLGRTALKRAEQKGLDDAAKIVTGADAARELAK